MVAHATGIVIGDRYGQWRNQVGGTGRRPTTTACNLPEDLQLSLAVVVRTGLSCAKRVARLDDVGGNTSRDALFPSVFPPDPVGSFA